MSGIAILKTDKIDFKSKKVIGDKDGHCIMINGTINQEDVIFINIYSSNIGAPKYIKQLLKDLKGEVNSNMITVWDLNTSLTSMDRSSRQKFNKEILDLKETLDQTDLIDM